MARGDAGTVPIRHQGLATYYPPRAPRGPLRLGGLPARPARTAGLGLGVVLYQLPPFFRRDDARLEAFLASLPPSPKSALEFRHVSWFADETYRLLEKHGVALCINDNDEFDCPRQLTAKHTYVRLRRDDYPPEERAAWRDRLRDFEAQGVEVFAFIKHKDNPDAPLIALDFAEGFKRAEAPPAPEH
jgi:uncharacterized protein YecE (DUF72 family)